MKRVIIQQEEIYFELNKDDFTTEIISSPNASGNISISHSIEYQSQKYRIISVNEGSFMKNSKIKSITFHKDSILYSIKKKAFSVSTITNIFIPASVRELEDGWCKETYNLTNVTISPKNPNFKYLDKDQKIIVGKSDTSSEIFDIIFFACRDIRQVIIPKQIKYIKPYAFEKCSHIKAIKFSKDSEIQFFGKKFLAFSKIKSIFIPDHVKELEDGWCCHTSKLTTVIISPKNINFKYLDNEHKIIVGKSDKNSEIFDTIVFACRDITKITIPKQIKYIKSHAFEDCWKLKTVEISEDSEIRTFCNKSFESAGIESLYIPLYFDEFQDNWCSDTNKLTTVIISPKNVNFKYLNEEHKIIIGKSDKNSDIFDTIFFACRDIKKATIPKQIKYIRPHAFENCSELKTVKFSSDSNLIFIGRAAFSFSSISEITIPKSVTQIQKCAFNNCTELERVVFENGSKLTSFEKCVFKSCINLRTIKVAKDMKIRSIEDHFIENTKIDDFFIPSTVENIEQYWCYKLKYLTNVIISPDNKNFKYLDEDHKIVVGKSDKNSDIFDTIVFACRDIKEVMIPKQIKYIQKNAFGNCQHLKTISFSNDSKIRFLPLNIFPLSFIENLTIPASVEELDEGWCNETICLKNVIISPDNKNFKYLDEDHKIIVGKSDKNSDIFDTIVFACRDIKEAIIPKHIKYIQISAFEKCKHLQVIEFSKGSQLLFIGQYAFSNSSIKKFTVPKSVTKIEQFAFNSCNEMESFIIENDSKLTTLSYSLFLNCQNLEKVEIPEKSSLKTIENEVFSSSSIKSLFIPETVEELEEDWCIETSELNNVTISPKNKNFKYLDKENKIIVGKSDNNSDIFDTIIFVNRGIKEITIPKQIKYILPDLFEKCNKLRSFKISEGSEISTFTEDIFLYSSFRSITIPSSINEFEDGWCFGISRLKEVILSGKNKNFKYMDNINWRSNTNKAKTVKFSPKRVSFSLDEEHKIIVGKSDKNSDIFDTIIFACRDIKQITIPKQIKYIKPHAFNKCYQLETVKFSEDSELLTIGSFSFASTSLQQIKIPKNVSTIESFAFYYSQKLESVEFEEGSQIKSFKKNLFNNCSSLEKLKITDNSSLQKICRGAFNSTKIKSLFIPATVDDFEDGWCEWTVNLTTVIISPNNVNFNYLDEEHKIIVGKSDINSDIFDTIIFACRDIKEAIIPKQIRYIKPYSFEKCNKLKTVKFSEDSEIRTFKSKSFSSSSIESIVIPAKVEELDENWCDDSKELKTVIISPKNVNFKYLDEEHKIIVGKSDKNSDIFDTIVFACRDIKKATIPKQIKYIKPSSFENCKQLKKFKIPDDSEIISIGCNAFANTSIVSFRSPKKIYEYESQIFYGCKDLLCFEFLGDSFLKYGCGNIFSDCENIVLISFPNVQRLDIQMEHFPIKISNDFRLFISAGKEVSSAPKNNSSCDFSESSDSSSTSDFDSSSSSSNSSSSSSDEF